MEEVCSATENTSFNITATVESKSTPLHDAAWDGFLNTCENLIIEDKADVNEKDEHQETPLHYSVIHGHVEICKLLVTHKANVNAKNARDITPLHYAVMNDHVEICQLLITHKADLNAKDVDGDTPYRYAQANHYLQTILRGNSLFNDKAALSKRRLKINSAVNNKKTELSKRPLKINSAVNDETELSESPIKINSAVVVKTLHNPNLLIPPKPFPSSLTNNTEPTKTTTIVIPDLNGNALIILWYAAKLGLMTISDDGYNDIADICFDERQNNRKIDVDTANRLTDLIRTIKVNPESNYRLLLIGDVLADRGPSDWPTLLLLKKLIGKFSVLYSNHDDFLFAALRKNHTLSLCGTDDDLDKTQANSGKNLVDLSIEDSTIEEKSMSILEEIYRPRLFAIGYSYNEQEKRLSIYTHAPVGFETIRELTELYDVRYKAKTAKELMETIDNINKKFQERLVTPAELQREIERGNQSPLVRLIWNRIKDNSELDLTSPNKNEYRVIFLHGHAGTRLETTEKRINLDIEGFGRPGHLQQAHALFVVDNALINNFDQPEIYPELGTSPTDSPTSSPRAQTNKP